MKKENKLKRIFNKEYNKMKDSDIQYLNEIRMEIESKRIFEKTITKEELNLLEEIQIVFENTIDLLEKDSKTDEFSKRSKLVLKLMKAIKKGNKKEQDKIIKKIEEFEKSIK